MEVAVGLILAAFLGLIPATIAKNKGYDFKLWWVYGWLLFIVALIHVLIIPDKNTSAVYNNGISSCKTQNQSAADETKKYKELFDQGVLTEEEFTEKKEQLLKFI